MRNNNVEIVGTMMNIHPTHEMEGEQFYGAEIATKRQSGYIDYIVLNVPAFISKQMQEGCKYKILGEIRSRNVFVSGKRKVLHSVFVHCAEETYEEDYSEVELKCRIVSKRSLQRTKDGKDIVSTMCSVERTYDHVADYIPCVFWNRNAMKASVLNKGAELCIKGRVEGRQYLQTFDDDSIRDFISHSVVVNDFKIIKED